MMPAFFTASALFAVATAALSLAKSDYCNKKRTRKQNNANYVGKIHTITPAINLTTNAMRYAITH